MPLYSFLTKYTHNLHLTQITTVLLRGCKSGRLSPLETFLVCGRVVLSVFAISYRQKDLLCKFFQVLGIYTFIRYRPSRLTVINEHMVILPNNVNVCPTDM